MLLLGLPRPHSCRPLSLVNAQDMAWRSVGRAASRVLATGTCQSIAQTCSRHLSLSSGAACLAKNACIAAGCAQRTACLPSLSVLATSILQQASPARGLSGAAPAFAQPSITSTTSQGAVSSSTGQHLTATGEADSDDDEAVPTRRKRKRLKQQPGAPASSPQAADSHVHLQDTGQNLSSQPRDCAQLPANVNHVVSAEASAAQAADNVNLVVAVSGNVSRAAMGSAPQAAAEVAQAAVDTDSRQASSSSSSSEVQEEEEDAGEQMREDDMQSPFVYILSSAERVHPQLSQSEKGFLARKAQELLSEKRLPRMRVGERGIHRSFMSALGDMLEKHEIIRVEVPRHSGFEGQSNMEFVGWLLESCQDCVVLARTGRHLTVYRDSSVPRPAATRQKD